MATIGWRVEGRISVLARYDTGLADATRDDLVDRRFKTDKQGIEECVKSVRQRSVRGWGWHRSAIESLVDSAKEGAAHIRLVVEGNSISVTQHWLID